MPNAESNPIETFRAFAEHHNRSIENWITDAEAAAERCARDPNATPEQKQLARDVLGCAKSYRNLSEQERFREAAHEAFQIGLAYEMIRFAPYRKPAEHGMALGCLWRGQWVKLTPLEIRIVAFLHNAAEASLRDLVRTAWCEPYYSENRSKYDKALRNYLKTFNRLYHSNAHAN